MIKLILGSLVYIFGVYLFFNVIGFVESFLSMLLSLYGLQKIGEGLDDMRSGRLRDFIQAKNSPTYKKRKQSQETSRINYFYVIKLRELFDGRSGVDILASVMASISIHIAKADGKISDKEIESIRYSVDRVFNGKADHTFISEVVRITKEHLQSIGLGNILTSILEIFQIYIELIQYLPEDERNDFFISLFTMLYEVAIADDGKLNYPEEKIFQALYSNFGIPLEYQDLIKRTAQYNYNARKVNKDKPASISPEKKFKEALEFYGLKESYTKDELEKAWKKMALLYHPDKYHNSDPEVYRVMNEKFVQAKEIYEFLLNKIK
jgi:uncharacterized tellurite resistance protein B-like protein